MLFTKYLNSFFYFNIFLLFLFSLSVNSIESFTIINSVAYAFFHFSIIYLGLYYFRKLLFFIFFIYGLGFDLLLIFQIGPHLFIFMIMLVFFSQIKKYLQFLSSIKIYLVIIVVQIFMIFFEMIISDWFFNYKFDFYVFFELIIVSLLISYPVFFIFAKIDNLN